MTRQGSHTCASRSLSNRTYIIGIPQAAWTPDEAFHTIARYCGGPATLRAGGQLGVMPVDKSVPASST